MGRICSFRLCLAGAANVVQLLTAAIAWPGSSSPCQHCLVCISVVQYLAQWMWRGGCACKCGLPDGLNAACCAVLCCVQDKVAKRLKGKGKGVAKGGGKKGKR